eukprot:15076105-Alexandrium_andersonii.AAC.1
MVATKQANGRAGGASWVGPEGRSRWPTSDPNSEASDEPAWGEADREVMNGHLVHKAASASVDSR